MISCYYGKTESGKSYLANIHSKQYKRVVIYDNAHCFNEGTIVKDLSIQNLQRIFKEYASKKSFRLIFRTPRTMNEIEGANRVARFVFKLGQLFKDIETKTKKPLERFLFLVDEADKVSGYSKTSGFYLAVTKGRHYCFDCFGISQGVTKLPNYFRENASKSYVFKLPETEELRKIIGRKASGKLRELEQYSYMYATDSAHQVKVINKAQKEIESIEF